METGESRTPRPEEPISRMYYKLVRRFVLGLFRHRRRILERPSRLNLWPPLPASGWPHPGLMAPDIPSSGNSWEQT